jgi:hypothetical protein
LHLIVGHFSCPFGLHEVRQSLSSFKVRKVSFCVRQYNIAALSAFYQAAPVCLCLQCSEMMKGESLQDEHKITDAPDDLLRSPCLFIRSGLRARHAATTGADCHATHA